jgi:hypothetical protein
MKQFMLSLTLKILGYSVKPRKKEENFYLVVLSLILDFGFFYFCVCFLETMGDKLEKEVR